MKHYLNLVLKTFIVGITFSLGLIGGVYIYTSAFSTLSHVNNGDTLSATMWNDVIDRVSNIFWNSTNSSLELNGGIKIGNTSNCNNTLTGTLRVSTTALQVCDGSGWIDMKSFSLGTASNPSASCYSILQNIPTSVNGIYRIKPDSNPAVQVRCDMSGGGRTLVNIIKMTAEHMNPNAIGTLTSLGQSNYWKIADTYINAIAKNTGYKLTCGVTSITFPPSCNFGAATPANGTCLLSPGTYSASRGGLSAYDGGGVAANKIIYGGIGAPSNGCLDSITWAWTTGTLRVK